MSWLGVYLAACLLLVVAGAAKVRRPDGTARALGQLTHVLASTRLARAAALTEVLLGGIGLAVIVPGVAIAVAISYLGFGLYLAWLLRRGGPANACGCLGGDLPPTPGHVLVNLVMAVGAASVAAAGVRESAASALGRQPWSGIPLASASIVCAAVAVAVLSGGARLAEARNLVAWEPAAR